MDSFDHLADPRIVAAAGDAARRIAARAEGESESDSFLAGCIDDLRDSGYLRIIVPERLGGLGGSIVDVCVAQEKVSRAFGSAGLTANMHLQYLGSSLVSGMWPEERLDAFLRGVTEHGWIINNCQAETELGSPARGGLHHTTATRAKGGWRIDGKKSWSTAAPHLTHFAVGATVRADSMPEHLGQFLVRRDAPGVRIDPTWDALSMRESASHDIVFEAVHVPDEDVIRVSPAGDRYVPPLETAPWHGLPFAATYIGIAVAARDFAARFAATRIPSNLGHPIGDLPAVRAKLGEIEALLFASRRMIFDTARDWVEAKAPREQVAAQVPMVKYWATNNAVHVTDLALRITGGFGLMESNPVERCFRDVRAGLIHPPLDDVTLATAATLAMREFQH
ncbi:MAG: acyl-CoA/acyl-ACP dehydrogenase [Chloroflexi bacterium]|nr:acyl-CoA/acyl-ACP dehydrogenase [Chloroflexota bacterium]